MERPAQLEGSLEASAQIRRSALQARAGALSPDDCPRMPRLSPGGLLSACSSWRTAVAAICPPPALLLAVEAPHADDQAATELPCSFVIV